MAKLNVVLFEPEIAQNTGNIIRTCDSFDVKLHLIRPYNFFLTDKVVKRCSTNHLNLENISEYDDFEEFLNKNNIHNNLFLFTKRGVNTPNQIDYKKIYDSSDIFLMFGKESTGIPIKIIDQYKNNSIRIPMKENVISINLANSVAIGLYEVIKQLDYLNLKK